MRAGIARFGSFQRLGDPAVQLAADGHRLLAVDNLADQGVGEREVVISREHQPRHDRLVEHLKQFGFRPAENARQQRRLGLADDCRGGENLAARLAQPGKAAFEHLLENRRAIQAPQREALDCRGQCPQQLTGFACAFGRVVPRGDHEQHRQMGHRVDSRPQQLRRSTVGPMDVFEHHHRRLHDRRDILEHASEQFGAGDLAGRVRQRAGIAPELTQQLAPWPVRRRHTLRAATPRSREPLAGRLLGERLDQRGLADPRFAEHQNRATVPARKVVEEGAQHPELPFPPNQPSTQAHSRLSRRVRPKRYVVQPAR